MIYMNPGEISTIESYLKKDDIMLEWGAGGSTLHFSELVKEYHSIEHDKKWYEKVLKDIPKNTKLLLKIAGLLKSLSEGIIILDFQISLPLFKLKAVTVNSLAEVLL